MEDNKDNSVKETEQKPQEQTEGKTGGKTMAENGKKAGLTEAAGHTACPRTSPVAAIQDIMTSSSNCIPLPTAMMYPSMPPISR